MIKIAFDIGGVLSKYPEVFRPILRALYFFTESIEIHIVSDMHPKDKILKMLSMNGFSFIPAERVHSADYQTYGENCKALLCATLGFDVLVDDFDGYLHNGSHVRLKVVADPSKPYYADTWKTDGSEGDFGRRRSSSC